MDVEYKARQRTLLLHYPGGATNEIFKTLPDTEAGEGEDLLDKAVQTLIKYFTPRKIREYEVHVFRQANQETNASISAFHARLR